MKTAIDCDALTQALKTIKNLSESPTVSFKVGKSVTTLIGANKGSAVSVSIPTKLLEKSEHTQFTLESSQLSAAILKHKSITLEVTATEAIISDKKYRAELLTQQFDPPEVLPPEIKEGKGIKIKQTFLKSIQKQMEKIELRPLLSTYDYVPIGVKSTEKGTFVACYDFYQAAFFFDKDAPGSSEFVLPSNIFSTIIREIKDQNYTLNIGESAVYAYNDVFEISIAIPQAEGDQVKFEDMIALYKSLKDIKDSTTLVINKEDITGLLENASAVHETVHSSFMFTVKGDQCKLELKSSGGRVTSVFKLNEKPKNDIEFTCDFGFFKKLLEKAPKVLHLQVVPERMLLFKDKPAIYMMSLV